MFEIQAQGRTRGSPSERSIGRAAARRKVLAYSDSRADESLVMPAWQRYDGNFYQAAGSLVGTLAEAGRLLILSGGYGVVDERDPIGVDDRELRLADWPDEMLEHRLAETAADSGLHLVALVSTSTTYTQLLRRRSWEMPAGRTPLLVTLHGVRGVSAVSRSLGQALRTFVQQRHEYPAGLTVEALGR